MNDKYNDIYEKFSKLQWLLHRHHIMNHAEHGPFADTTRGQGRVLAMLKIQPEISTKDLSYLLGIRIASLNELLNKLEKSGYLVRKPSEADKRVMIIHLTEKGREQKQIENDYSGIFDCLDETELSTFGEYLDRIISALETQVGAELDEDELEDWIEAARSRMGNEMFEQLMSVRGGFGRRRRGPGYGPGYGPGHGPGHESGHGPGHGPEHGHGRGPGHKHGPGHGLKHVHGPGHGPGDESDKGGLDRQPDLSEPRTDPQEKKDND